MELVQFKADHWMALKRDTSDLGAHAGLLREKAGVAYTALNGDMILGCAGIIAEGNTGVVWALLSEDLKRDHPMWFLRKARKLLMPVIQALGLLRVEALVDPELDINCKWIEWMGFELEFVKKLAGDSGQDMFSYVLFPRQADQRRKESADLWQQTSQISM